MLDMEIFGNSFNVTQSTVEKTTVLKVISDNNLLPFPRYRYFL